MAKNTMDVTAFVGKLLEEQDVDLLREAVRILAPSVDGGRGHYPDRGGALRADRLNDGPPERLPHQDLGHPGRHRRAQGPEDRAGELLPCAPRASPAGRAGARRG